MVQPSAFFDAVRHHLNDATDGELYGVCAMLSVVRSQGKRVFLIGNGGSSAIASHLAVDLLKVLKIRAMTFHDPALSSCYANDYSWDEWMAKAIYSYADEGDLLIAISSSGQSEDILRGVVQARYLKMLTVTLSGFDADNPLRKAGDLNLWTSTTNYNCAETVHQTWLLACVERLAGQPGAIIRD